MSSRSPISRFERFARDLVEGSVDRLLGQPGVLAAMARELGAAAESSRSRGLAANQYTVKVHPTTLASLNRQPEMISPLLEETLARLGQQRKLVFAGELRVEVVADDLVESGKIDVSARRGVLDEEPTAVLRRKKGATAPLKMAEAFLIVNGRRHITLQKAVSTIGRSLDNDIILEDPGVSRTHAQIRWRNGRFEIFDVGSRAGLMVNGQRVTSAELRSGDVVKLGAAAIIYGEEDRLVDPEIPTSNAPPQITQEISADDLP